jgi:hypothetical protein
MQKTEDRNHELSEATLLKIFLLVPPDQRRKLPLVSRKWNRICREHSELWSRVQVGMPGVREFTTHRSACAMPRDPPPL